MPPKLLTKSDRAGGVLPVNAAARNSQPKPPATRLKLEIRRLPPGLTLVEFEETLGEDWKLGNGKVDWREYRQGKLKPPGKLPEQSRCYMHVVSEALVREFEQRFLAVVFHDKAGTFKNSDLKHLPPTLGFAPNQRVPAHGKQRLDNRQGTIDQDPEFIAFLEAETQPIPRSTAIDGTGAEKEESKVEVKSTPLIDDLREKKANKAKAAASKADKKGQAKAETKETGKGKEAPSAKGQAKQDPKRLEQPGKDGGKASSKQAGGKQTQTAAQAPLPSSQQKAASPAKKKKAQQSPKPANASPVPTPAPASPAPQRASPAQRQRGNTDGIKKMLQKDLGIRPKTDANQTPSRAKGGSQGNSTQQASQPIQPKGKATAAGQGATAPGEKQTQTPAPAPASTPAIPKAFLKHANPSQGMTEVLIQQALTQYGDVINVTIDPRKGSAIAVFKNAEGLKAAIEAKKVTVANGAVEVMEYKDRSGGAGGGGAGSGGRGARGGSKGGNRSRGAGQGAATPSAPTPAATATPATTTTTTNTT